MRIASIHFLSLMALVACGCASNRSAQEVEGLLPFHVAVIPLGAEDVRTGIDEVTEHDASEFEIELESGRISEAVQRSLDETLFTVATLLERPSSPGDLADDEYWIEQAREIGADLLLECHALKYERWVTSHKINLYSSSLPLFLLGGPFVYFINDRAYAVDARVSVTLYDVNPILAAVDEPGAVAEIDRALMIQSFDGRADDVRVNFLDRTDFDDLGAYGASLVMPTGFLAKSNETVRAVVIDQAIESMGKNVADAISDHASEILEPDPRLARFFLDVKTIRTRRTAEGGVRFDAEVVLHRSKDVDALDSALLYVDGDAYEVDIELIRSQDDALRFRASAIVASARAGARISLRLSDNGHVPTTRSWTVQKGRSPAPQSTPVSDETLAYSGGPR
jgi:hypothetical protein